MLMMNKKKKISTWPWIYDDDDFKGFYKWWWWFRLMITSKKKNFHFITSSFDFHFTNHQLSSNGNFILIGWLLSNSRIVLLWLIAKFLLSKCHLCWFFDKESFSHLYVFLRVCVCVSRFIIIKIHHYFDAPDVRFHFIHSLEPIAFEIGNFVFITIFFSLWFFEITNGFFFTTFIHNHHYYYYSMENWLVRSN